MKHYTKPKHYIIVLLIIIFAMIAIIIAAELTRNNHAISDTWCGHVDCDHSASL